MDDALMPGAPLEAQGEDTANKDKNKSRRSAKPKVKVPLTHQLLKACLYSVGIYVFIGCVIMSPVYTMVVLRPDRGDYAQLYTLPKIINSPREEYFFPAKTGEKMHGWLFRTPKSDRVVIVHHGNAGNLIHRLFIAKHLIVSGASVFIYDYRGYGKSEGSTALTNLVPDGLDAYDFVRDKLKFSHIVNYGESIGSHIACTVSKERPCEGLILQSGICSLPAVAKDGPFFMKAFPDEIFPKPHLENTAIISDIKKPMLLVHGLKDTLVPWRHSEKLFALASEPKWFVKLPACGHNDVGDQDEVLFEKTLMEFMDSVKSGDFSKMGRQSTLSEGQKLGEQPAAASKTNESQKETNPPSAPEKK